MNDSTIHDLIKLGKTQSEIAEILGVSRQYVHKVAEKLKSESANIPEPPETGPLVPGLLCKPPLSITCHRCDRKLTRQKPPRDGAGLGWKGTNFCSERCYMADYDLTGSCVQCGKNIDDESRIYSFLCSKKCEDEWDKAFPWHGEGLGDAVNQATASLRGQQTYRSFARTFYDLKDKGVLAVEGKTVKRGPNYDSYWGKRTS